MLNENMFMDFVNYTFCMKASIDSMVLSVLLACPFMVEGVLRDLINLKFADAIRCIIILAL
jgi:hypothetical protein